MLNYIEIQQSIINWFLLNKRDLPWRKNRSWYKVWVSEIMFQQTQVDQVIDYYHKFMINFPTIYDLASTELQKDSTRIQFDGIKHTYTHFNLLMYPIIQRESEFQVNNKLYVEHKWLKLEDVRKRPIHKAMQKVLMVIESN